MFVPYKIIIENETFWLTPQRTIYWEDERALVVADLHLGKTGHFRKSGIPVPNKVYREDLQVLLHQVLYYKVEKLLIIGDMTHSVHNRELELFVRWRKDFSALSVELVKGNHDILTDRWYQEARILVHHDELRIRDFAFRHEKLNGNGHSHEPAPFTFQGHVHPAIKLRGYGRQQLNFPCFHFTDDHCILPAFSKFTGGYLIRPAKDDAVFAVVGNEVMKVK